MINSSELLSFSAAGAVGVARFRVLVRRVFFSEDMTTALLLWLAKIKECSGHYHGENRLKYEKHDETCMFVYVLRD